MLWEDCLYIEANIATIVMLTKRKVDHFWSYVRHWIKHRGWYQRWTSRIKVSANPVYVIIGFLHALKILQYTTTVRTYMRSLSMCSMVFPRVSYWLKSVVGKVLSVGFGVPTPGSSNHCNKNAAFIYRYEAWLHWLSHANLSAHCTAFIQSARNLKWTNNKREWRWGHCLPGYTIWFHFFIALITD